MKSFIAIDTETGGLDATRHSLLTVGCVLFEANKSDMVVVKSGEFAVQAHEYVVTPRAMQVNKLDLSSLPGIPVRPQNLQASLKRFCGNRRPQIVAHNWPFDKSFLEAVRPNPIADFNYRVCDTMSLMTSLSLYGLTTEASLYAGCKFFDIEYDPLQAHGAMYDAQLTAELFWNLMKLLKPRSDA